MFGGFIYMLWNVGLVVVIVATAIGIVICLRAYVESFVKQMKDNADLRAWVKSEVDAYKKLWTLEVASRLQESADLVAALDQKLDVALQKPELAPESASTEVSPAPQDLAPVAKDAAADDQVPEPKNESVTMSNPF